MYDVLLKEGVCVADVADVLVVIAGGDTVVVVIIADYISVSRVLHNDDC